MAESFSVEAILSATDKNMTSTMNSVLGKVKSFGSNVTSIVAGLGITKAISTTMSVLNSSLDGAVTRFDTLQSYPKVMSALGFSTEQSQASVVKLNESVQGLPTSLADVVTTAKSLSAVTGNIDKATDTTIALNHAFLASGASTEDASRGLTQYSQMLAKGTVDIQSWRSLQETMAPALTKVAKKLGIASGSANELYDALQEGTITFDQFNDAMIECDTETGGFADTAQEASKGISTSMTNIKSAVQNLEMGFMSALNKMLQSKGFSGIVDSLEKVKSKIYDLRNALMKTTDGGLTWEFNDSVVDKVSSAFDYIHNIIVRAQHWVKQFWDGFTSTGVLDALAEAFGTTADSFDDFTNRVSASAVFEQLGKDIGTIVKGLANVVKHISEFVGSLDASQIKTFTDVVKKLAVAFVAVKAGSKISSIFKGIVGSASGAVKSVSNVTKAIKQLAKGGISGGFNPLGGDSTAEISNSGEKIKSIFEGIGNVIQSVGTSISNVFTGLGSGIKTALEGVGTVIESFGTAISSVATGIGQGLATAFEGLGTAIAMVPPTTWLALSVAIIAVGVAMALVASQGEGMQAILEGVATCIQALQPVVQAVVDGIVAVVQALPAIFESVGKAVKDALDGVADIVESFGKAVKDAFDGVADVITAFGDAVSGILDSVSGVIESIGNSAKKCGEGFKLMAQGIETITNLPLLDMTASLMAVATGVGAISAKASGLGEVGTQIQALGVGLSLLVACQSGIDGLCASLPTLVSTVQQLGGTSESLTTASTAFTTFASSIASTVGQVNSVSTSMTQLVTVTNTISNAFTSASSTVTNSMNSIIQAMQNATTQATTSGQTMGNNFKNGLKSGMSSAKNTATNMCSKIITAFNSCVSQATYCGQMIGQGLANGLASSASAVYAQAQRLASYADQAIQAKAKIGSPSRVQYQNGIWFGQGLANGIKAMKSDVKKASEDLMYLPTMASASMSSFGYSGALDSAYDYSSNANITVETPLYINDKEFARATARATQDELNRASKFNARLRGAV